MRSRGRYVAWFSCLFVLGVAHAQLTRVSLDSLTTLDDPAISVEIMKTDPPKPVRLPPIDAPRPRFIKQFYSWRMTNDPDIVIMVVSGPDGDHLYIDRNLNGDLTDDGPPVVFPFNEDSLTFDIISPSDSRQRTRLLLARTLAYRRQSNQMPDSTKRKFVDDFGNLNPRFAKFCGALKGDPDFKGDFGSFYFDDRVTLRRGTLTIDGMSHAIGLFDYSNNGLFNDDDDALIVDTHGDGKLQYSDIGEVHKLYDVFSLGAHNLKIHDLDKYGTWVELERTSEPVTSYFAQQLDSIVAASGRKIPFNPALWNIQGTSLDSTPVVFNTYRGKYLLINFWGDWCKPCIEEIPALVQANREYPSYTIQFVSFVKVADLQKVKKLVAESGMTWPQVYLDKRMEEFFKVSMYPTNILIFPDTTECLITTSVNERFFETHVK